MQKLWLSVIAVAACGEVKVNHLPDGNTDGPPIDGTTHGIVSVEVLDPQGDGGPAVGVPVLFIDTNGTQKVATGNDGKASADVLPGASVTAVVPQGNGTIVESILGVAPGDNLVLGDVSNPPNPSVGNYIVNWNGVMGQNYEVFGPCGEVFVNGPMSTATLPMNQNCVQDPMDLLIVVLDINGNPLGSVEKTNVHFTSGGSSTLDTGSLTGFSTFNATYTNLAGVGSINLERFSPDGFGFNTGTGASVTGSTLSLTPAVPLTSTALLESGFSQASGGNNGNQRITQTIPGNSTTFGLDADGTLLGWLGSPTVDVATNQVTIPYDQSTTTKDDSDIAFIALAFDRPAAVDGGTDTFFEWLVFQATPGNFTLPQLPPEVGEVNTKAGDTLQFFNVGALETDGLSGYADARKNPFAAFESLAFNTTRLPAGTTRVRFTQGPQLDLGARRHISRR